MKIRNKIILRMLIPLILGSAVILAGCAQYEVVRKDNTYSTFIMKEGAYRFSFEFAHDKFEVYKADMDKEGIPLRLTLNGPSIGEIKAHTSITLDIFEFSQAYPTWQYRMDRVVSEWAGLPSNIALGRFPVTISGEPGEEYVHSYIVGLTSDMIGRGFTAPRLVGHQVSFEHAGLLWNLRMIGVESSAEADNVEFQHIVKTFKILN